MESLHVGTLVINPLMPDWGPGKIVKSESNRVHVVWRDLSDRAARIMVTSAVQRAADQHDDILDNLPPLVEKDGKLLLPKARVTFKQAVDKFFEYFPQGFDDPRFLGDSKFKGERLYKVAAHEYFVTQLGGKRFCELLNNDLSALVKEVERCVGKVNVLHMTESAAFSEGLRDARAAFRYLEALANVLEAEEISESIYVPYVDAVCGLPASRAKTAKWTIATIVPFLAQPERHMFLKPEVTRNAADSLGFELNYRAEPNWLTYKCLLRMAHIYREMLAEHKPRDFIDVQSFFYVACGGYEGIAERKRKSKTVSGVD